MPSSTRSDNRCPPRPQFHHPPINRNAILDLHTSPPLNPWTTRLHQLTSQRTTSIPPLHPNPIHRPQTPSWIPLTTKNPWSVPQSSTWNYQSPRPNSPSATNPPSTPYRPAPPTSRHRNIPIQKKTTTTPSRIPNTHSRHSTPTPRPAHLSNKHNHSPKST